MILYSLHFQDDVFLIHNFVTFWLVFGKITIRELNIIYLQGSMLNIHCV